jgi:hypothetical protein
MRPKMTITKLRQSIQNGLGSGTGHRYQPWIKIKRSTSAARSNLHESPSPYFFRAHHYLSSAEYNFALVMWWCGCEDIREQYPLWPWPHRHPLVQLGMKAGDHPGMEYVAEVAKIRLARYPNTAIKTILTIDQVLTVREDVNPRRLIGVSCKPETLLLSSSAISGVKPRMELDRLYFKHADLPFRVVHPEKLSKRLIWALDAICPNASQIDSRAFIEGPDYARYVELMDRRAYDEPSAAVSVQAAKVLGWNKQTEMLAYHSIQWFQHLDIDVVRSNNGANPFVRGGRQIREQIARQYLMGN